MSLNEDVQMYPYAVSVVRYSVYYKNSVTSLNISNNLPNYNLLNWLGDRKDIRPAKKPASVIPKVLFIGDV